MSWNFSTNDKTKIINNLSSQWYSVIWNTIKWKQGSRQVNYNIKNAQIFENKIQIESDNWWGTIIIDNPRYSWTIWRITKNQDNRRNTRRNITNIFHSPIPRGVFSN